MWWLGGHMVMEWWMSIFCLDPPVVNPQFPQTKTQCEELQWPSTWRSERMHKFWALPNWNKSKESEESPWITQKPWRFCMHAGDSKRLRADPKIPIPSLDLTVQLIRLWSFGRCPRWLHLPHGAEPSSYRSMQSQSLLEFCSENCRTCSGNVHNFRSSKKSTGPGMVVGLDYSNPYLLLGTTNLVETPIPSHPPFYWNPNMLVLWRLRDFPVHGQHLPHLSTTEKCWFWGTLSHINVWAGQFVTPSLRSPYQEFQRFKTHPRIKALLEATNKGQVGQVGQILDTSDCSGTSLAWAELELSTLSHLELDLHSELMRCYQPGWYLHLIRCSLPQWGRPASGAKADLPWRNACRCEAIWHVTSTCQADFLSLNIELFTDIQTLQTIMPPGSGSSYVCTVSGFSFLCSLFTFVLQCSRLLSFYCKMSLVNSEQKTLDLKAAKKASIFRDGVLRSGCSAGFLNVPKIKGSHTAMKRPGSNKTGVCDAHEKGFRRRSSCCSDSFWMLPWECAAKLSEGRQ